ncbi:MAG: hypothetical protein U0Q11_16320 [Vicinamibacterales bacterium]
MQIHPPEQLALHERTVTAWVVSGETDEFIEVEGRRLAEVDVAGRIQPREFRVQRHWRPSRRKAKHHRRLFSQIACDLSREGARRACG